MPLLSAIRSTLVTSAHRWWGIFKPLPVAGSGLVLVSVLVNVAIGALPLGFLIGTSVMVQRVPAVAPLVRGSTSHWGPALVALGFSVAALVLQNLFAPAQAAVGELVTRRVDGRARPATPAAASRSSTASACRCPPARPSPWSARTGRASRPWRACSRISTASS